MGGRGDGSLDQNGGETRMAPNDQIVTTSEADSYAAAIPGMELVSNRTGVGDNPCIARSVVHDDGIVLMNSVGFPLRSQMTLSDDSLLVVTVSSAPPGTRFCGYDLDPGSTLLYAPGTEHMDTSPAGVEYTAAIVRYQIIEEMADELHMDMQIPSRGSVRLLHPSSNPRSIASVLGGGVLAPIDNEDPSTLVRGVVHALASELSEEARSHRLEGTSVRESRRIVQSCLEFVNDAGGRPSIAALCGVAFVSERRLRDAFVDAFGVPPMKHFRDQKLNEARTRLLATSNRQTVMEISIDVGIQNGGRFAQRYFELFGELPSTTLQTTG